MLRRGFGLPEVVLLVLGANLLASFLVVPMLHHRAEDLRLPLLASLLPIGLLVAGVLSSNRWILLLLFPLGLLFPISLRPSLAGAGTLSPTGFGLLGVALLAFIFGSAWVASASRATPLPRKRRRLDEPNTGAEKKHQRRLRVYTTFVLTCIAFPLTLIHALYLRPDAAEVMAARFPQRGPAASLLFGVLVMVLWLAIFLRHVAGPLRDHIRGDREQVRAIKALARRTRRGRRTSLALALYLAVAAGGLLFFWLHLRGGPPA